MSAASVQCGGRHPRSIQLDGFIVLSSRTIQWPPSPARWVLCGFPQQLHYDTKPDHENEVLAARLVELAHERHRFGDRRLHAVVDAKAHTPITSEFIACTVKQG